MLHLLEHLLLDCLLYTSLVFISVKIQFLDQVTSNGISNVLQKLLRCFNETSFVFPPLPVFPVLLVLYLKDSEFIKGSEIFL